ncbi:glycosyltransferase family 2 protein [Lactobacillus delbrueckii]|jgi:rhamnosyltransferase|uniref:glycosyltransferase family 2 protein n=1 Tax=Lactobacillus delbrueckii TaxID=1584 RepID=UPI00280C0B4E|nr:glycosyltransferase family 2 protein [Lactobacillus delbrueckii]
MNNIKIIAGIVSYNPDIARLRENILAIINQVCSLTIFVNGKESEASTRAAIKGIDHIDLIISSKNKGIAYALKRIMQYAIDNNADWVLSLDQDSVCQPGLISEYTKYLNLPNVGMLSCIIADRNTNKKLGNVDREYKEINDAITSAALTNVSAYEQINGYDEKLFIDCVDFDISFQLRKAGYKIYRINYYGLLHELGHGTRHRLCNKEITTLNYSPFRQYYQSRNWLYLRQKYPEFMPFIHTIKVELITQLGILFFEDKKWRKLTARWRGIRDSRRMA